MKIIEVRDFSFRYANGSRESLSHVSLDVEEGTFNVLCGKSGCCLLYTSPSPRD